MTACAGDTFDHLDTPALRKQHLRRHLRRQRRLLSPRQRHLAARRCTVKTLALPGLRRARRVGVYLHHGAELATTALIAALRQRGVEVYVPVTRAEGRMLWVALTSRTRLAHGRYGIRAPRQNKPRIPLNRLQWLVVPLVGVDTQLNRLGAGGATMTACVTTPAPAALAGLGIRTTMCRSAPV